MQSISFIILNLQIVLQEVNEAVMREYLQRVYSSILNHTELADLGDQIPQLLVQQAQSVVIMHKYVNPQTIFFLILRYSEGIIKKTVFAEYRNTKICLQHVCI